MRTSQQLIDQLFQKFKEIGKIESFTQQLQAYIDLETFLKSVQDEAYQQGVEDGRLKAFEVIKN